MASGNGTHESGARAERLRNENRKHERGIQNGFDNLRRDLPPYRAEMESEVSEVKVPGGMAKLPIPRVGRIAIGVGLGLLFACIGAAILVRSWPH